MNCREIEQWLSLYLDNELGRDEIKQLEMHLQKCPACMEYYSSLKKTKQFCSNLEVMDLPLGFHERLHQNLVKEERKNMHRSFKFKIAAGMAAGLILVFVGISLSGRIGLVGSDLNKLAYEAGDTADMAVEQNASQYRAQEEPEPSIGFSHTAKTEETAVPEDSFEGSGIAGVGENGGYLDDSSVESQTIAERKIIKSAYLSVETLEFDKFINTINGKLNSIGGYIESSNVEGIPRSAGSNRLRTAHFEIRVPKQYYQQFITDVGELANLLTKQENGQDITGQYFDTEARLKSLKIQEERLLTILEKAEKLQDIIEIERELSNVRYEIESLTGTLKKWDNMVEYSRISLDVYEVKELKEEEPEEITLWQRIVEGFVHSLEKLGDFSKDLVVFLASALPYLVIIGILGWIAWLLIKRFNIFKK